MSFQLLFELLFSPVQSVLVGGIRVLVGGGPRPRGSITDVRLGGASGGTEVKEARSRRIGQRYYTNHDSCCGERCCFWLAYRE